MRNVIKLFAVLASVGVAACDNPYDPDAPAIDPDAPRVHITTPEMGTNAGDVRTVKVTGTVTDDSGVESVKVNDLSAAVAGRSTRQALRALADDPATESVVVVSKPPDPAVLDLRVQAQHQGETDDGDESGKPRFGVARIGRQKAGAQTAQERQQNDQYEPHDRPLQ